MILPLRWLLLASASASGAKFIYQDFSPTAVNLYQGSEIGGLSISSDLVFTCGHTRDLTCGLAPQGCSSAFRTAGSEAATRCGNSDVVVTSHTLQGALQWTKMIGGKDADTCQSIAADSSVIAVGGTTGPKYGMKGAGAMLGGADMFVLALDKQGETLWGRHLGSSGYDRGTSVQIDGDYVYALGYSDRDANRFGNSYNKGQCFLSKMNKNSGIEEWSRTFGSDGDDLCTAMTITADGIYVVGKASERYQSGLQPQTIEDQTGKGGTDILVVKISVFTGAVLWARLLGSTKDDGALAVIRSADSQSVYVAGYTTVSTQFGYLLKISKDGDTEWSRVITQVQSLNIAKLSGATLFVSGTTNDKLTSGHTKISSGSDAAIFQLSSVTGNPKSSTVGSQIGIQDGHLESFRSSGLAVVGDEVYVSGTGTSTKASLTSGLLFHLAPNTASSAGDFVPSSGFGQADEISFVPGTSSTISIVSASGPTRPLPMMSVPEVSMGTSLSLQIPLQRGNILSKQWCSDATVSTTVTVHPVRLSSAGSVATEIATTSSGLLSVEAPSSVTFNSWASKTVHPSADSSIFASTEAASMTVRITNRALGDLRESIVDRAVIVVTLTAPCTSTTNHLAGEGCKITQDLLGSRTSKIAILVTGKGSLEAGDGDKEGVISDENSQQLAVGLGLGAAVCCLCMCWRYIVRPHRNIVKDRQELQNDIYADIQHQINSMKRIPSFVKESPGSMLRAVRKIPSFTVNNMRKIPSFIRDSPATVIRNIRDSPTVFHRGIAPNRNNRVAPERPLANLAVMNSTVQKHGNTRSKQQQQEIDRRLNRVMGTKKTSNNSLARSLSRNVMTFGSARDVLRFTRPSARSNRPSRFANSGGTEGAISSIAGPSTRTLNRSIER